MPRTNVPLQAFAANGELTDPTPVTIDATNQHVIPAAGQSQRIVLRVKNTFAGSKVVTVKAGDKEPAFRAGLGDLAVTLAQNAVKWIGPLESARFIQNDGTIEVDVASGTTGEITAFQWPGLGA
jgi:hypothetical protein